MLRHPTLTPLALLFILISVTAHAQSPWDIMDERLDYMIESAEELGYTVIKSEVSAITDVVTFSYGLAPGTYYVYADGGPYVYDLGLFVYGENGNELASDSYSFEIPSVTFILFERETVEIELEAFQLDIDRDYGYIALAIATDSDSPMPPIEEIDSEDSQGAFPDEGELSDAEIRYSRRLYKFYPESYWETWYESESEYLEAWQNYLIDLQANGGEVDYWQNQHYWSNRHDSETRDDDWVDYDWMNRDYFVMEEYRERIASIESRLDSLYSRAYRERLIPIVGDLGEIYDIETVRVTLPPGRYVVFAGGGRLVRSLDLIVMEQDGFRIADEGNFMEEDMVRFDIYFTTAIEIQVVAWELMSTEEPGFYCVLLCME